MIGVLCRPCEVEAVQEFFELFKTPWEFYVEGHAYQAILASHQPLPKADAKLCIVFAAEATEFDREQGLSVSATTAQQFIGHGDQRLPVYTKLALLRGELTPLVCTKLVLTKLQWEQQPGIVAGEVAHKAGGTQARMIRMGINLFDEIAYLLATGQPEEHALIPTVELYIAMLREWMLQAGIPVVEIPPIPWKHTMIACLTHDVDFIGIRQHKFDHTFWGFCYRAVVGSVVDVASGRSSLTKLWRNWRAVASVPFIHLGLSSDFWGEFVRYAEIEADYTGTFFIIPYKGKPGSNVQSAYAARRATTYDVDDLTPQIAMLRARGFEIGLHGIDAWQDTALGKAERQRITEVTAQEQVGVRMHWLCFDESSPAVLDAAGFLYDSTVGYNDAVGYRAGTTQVFRPSGTRQLLELPMHIQDTALFLSRRMALSEAEARAMCERIIDTTAQVGGVVTMLWHARSLSAERFWEKFYVQLLNVMREKGAWFATAAKVVAWFQKRRATRFTSYTRQTDRLLLTLSQECVENGPGLFVRTYHPYPAANMNGNGEATYTDILLHGQEQLEILLS